MDALLDVVFAILVIQNVLRFKYAMNLVSCHSLSTVRNKQSASVSWKAFNPDLFKNDNPFKM